MKKYIGAILGLLIACGTIAQNYGLKEPQEHSTLPFSRQDSLNTPVDRELVHEAKFVSNHLYSLNDGWILSADEAGTEEYNAVVPGTVLTTLVERGVYENPYYGLNMMKIPDDLCRKNWIYELKFKRPADGSRCHRLVFNGINYRADIFLNGEQIGNITGAFKRGVFDVSKQLKENNVLKVIIYPPAHPGIPHEQSPRTNKYGPNGGMLCLDGPTFISSEGWDWIPGIRDRNIGIWQDVNLLSTGSVVLSDAQVVTDLPLPDTAKADIRVKVNAGNLSSEPVRAKLMLHIAGKRVNKWVTLQAHSSKTVELGLCLRNPELWWPNGYGAPNLYNAQVVAEVQGKRSDELNTRFGVRELSYELMAAQKDGKKHYRIDYNPVSWLRDKTYPFDNMHRKPFIPATDIPTVADDGYIKDMEVIPDDENPYLVVKVNGQRIFCKGGNWGMDDGMKRTSKSRLEPYVRLHRDAGFTMIRNWTGESTQESFYELCDEYGMLVWNDFWYSTEGFNLEPKDKDLFMDNVRDVLTRFRNHPSIAVWCPRNEGYARPELEKELVKATSEIDGTRLYIGNSRYINLRTSGPWHYQKDASVYFTDIADGFSTEVGTMAVPLESSMRRMMAHEDLWPVSDTWYYHDFWNGKGDYTDTLEKLYGKATSLSDYCKKAQLINFAGHRAMFEAWNSRLWEYASGVLMWMSHCAWPSTVWQTYSWDYETTGAYFGVKKACEAYHIQMNGHDGSIMAVNTTLRTLPGVVATINAYSLDGRLLFEDKTELDLVKNSKVTLPFSFMRKLSEEVNPYIIKLRLTKSGELLSSNEYWETGTNGNFQAFNALKPVRPDAQSIGTCKGAYVVRIVNPSSVTAIGIKIKVKDMNKNEDVLPAYVSDGYFSLLPGETKEVSIDVPDRDNASLGVYAEGYNILSGLIIAL